MGDVTHHMKTCPTYQVMKSGHQAKAGLLHPLEIPTTTWIHVTTDLVRDLGESKGFMSVVVFVDKLLKMVHCVPYKEVNAIEYAKLFVDNVFWHHNLPKMIISD